MLSPYLAGLSRRRVCASFARVRRLLDHDKLGALRNDFVMIVALDPPEFRRQVSSTILGGYCGVSSMTVRDIDQAKLDAAQAKFGTKARAKRRRHHEA